MATFTRKLLPAAAMLLILAAALLLRLPHLGVRPFHGDEAVHAVKFRELREQGRYRYDPNEYHGPTIYYAALPAIALRGASYAETHEADYRLPIALLGAALLLLYLLLRDAISLTGALWAALLTAVSSPFVFYSRYFIQEVVLVGFTLMLIACGWRYCVSGRAAWLMAAAVAAGLMIATKETCVLTFVALGAGCFAARLAGSDQTERGERPKASPRLWIAAGAAAVTVAYLLLSGFLSHPAGPLGYIETYLPWLRRAGGTDLHRHPWHYYLSLLTWQQSKNGALWTELPVIALAVAGAAAGVSRNVAERAGADPGFSRFVLVYTIALTAIYSLIPYKTPWNLLSFYLGWLVLAGLGAGVLLSSIPPRARGAVGCLAALLVAGSLAWQSHRMTFAYQDDQPSPYAYAQPTRGVREIETRINELAAFSPQKDATVVQVVSRDEYYWPLPWYLRRLKNVGYWTGRVPEESEARLTGTPIIVSSAELDEALTARLNNSHFMVGFHTLREGVLVQVWVKNELWEPFVMSRPKPPTPNE